MIGKLLAVVLILAPCSALAALTPEQFVRQATERVTAGKMSDMVADMHPDELARFRTMFAPLFLETDKEVREAMMVGFLGRTMTAEEFNRIDGATLMRATLDKMQTTWDHQGIKVKIHNSQVLGHVMENDIAHVVTRSFVSANDIEVKAMEIISLRPYQDGWKMMLSADMEGIGKSIVQAIAARKLADQLVE